MCIVVAARAGKPQREAPEIRRPIAASRAPFMQKRDRLQQARYGRERARAQEVGLSAVPAIG